MHDWMKLPALCAAAALLGCGARLEPEPLAALQVIPDVDPAARTLQAVVTPYTRTDIATLVIRLYNVVNATETQVATRTLAASELNKTITFGALRPNRTYRARGTAQLAAGTTISDPATSFVDIVVGMDDTPAVGTLPVRLIDKVFNGRATSQPVAVTDGALVPAGIETITQLAPRIGAP